MTRHFDDIDVDHVEEFGAFAVDAGDVAVFRERFAPHLPMTPDDRDGSDREVAAQAHVYAMWSRMLYDFTEEWPILARIGQDQVRWYKAVRAGDVLSVRMTFLAKDKLDDTRGRVVSQHEVVNDRGELVLSLITRTVLAARPKAQRASG